MNHGRIISLPEAVLVFRIGPRALSPSFKRFEIGIDGGSWRPSQTSLGWDVRPGANRIEPRTLERFGVTGPVSTAEATP